MLAALGMTLKTLGCFLCFQVVLPLSGPAHGQSSHQCPLSPDKHQAGLEEHGCPRIRPWLLFHPHLPASLEKSFPGKFHVAAQPVSGHAGHRNPEILVPSLPGPGQHGGTSGGLSVRGKQFTLIFGGILQDSVKSVCREGSCFVLSSDQCWVSNSLWDFLVLSLC